MDGEVEPESGLAWFVWSILSDEFSSLRLIPRFLF
jgi:hypothetical protein